MVWSLQGMSFMHSSRVLPLSDQSIQNLAPTYEQLGDAFAHAKDKVIIAKVDADGAGKPLGKEFGVTGFPSAYS